MTKRGKHNAQPKLGPNDMKIKLLVFITGLLVLAGLLILPYSAYAATPDGVTVTLTGTGTASWIAPVENVDGSVLTDLSGYNIYLGRASRTYTDTIPVGLSDPTSGTFTIPITDENDINWFMAMTALDADGNESAYSNEVAKTLTVTFTDSRIPKPPTGFSVDLEFVCSTDNVLVTCEVTVL